MPRRNAAKVMVIAALLAGTAAGCSVQPAATGSSVTSCFQFAARAIQRHVTVSVAPAACRGLSQLEVNLAVSRALHAAAAGVHGKVGQRRVIARDSRYVAALIRAVPASSPSAATAQSSPPPGQPAAASSSRSSDRGTLGLAALIAWLVTVGLGASMMARWMTRIWRHGPKSRGPMLNFTHFGLALTGLLIWISYLATGLVGLAWAACGLLLAVASLGMTLVFLPPAATGSGDDPPPAGHPPVPVIAAHISAAVVTILLATLAAIGPG